MVVEDHWWYVEEVVVEAHHLILRHSESAAQHTGHGLLGVVLALLEVHRQDVQLHHDFTAKLLVITPDQAVTTSTITMVHHHHGAP